jgi:hypothetical protein
MICDAVWSAMTATAAGEWTSEMRVHLAGCEACASKAVEWALQCPPVVHVPPMFAADVARRARLAEPAAARRVVAPTAGAAAAGLLIASCAVWMAVAGTVTVLPVAAMLLAGGEAIVFAAWALSGDGLGRPSRRTIVW